MAGMAADADGKRETETSSGKRKKMRKNPSIVSLAIARTGSKPAGVSSMDPEDLIRGLYKGVLLDEDKVKFWIDENFHENCLMLFPKGLYIEGSSKDGEYWLWDPSKEDCFGGPVDTLEARLGNKLSWVYFMGKLPSYLLSPMITYEIVFKLMLTEDAFGWREPISLDLTLPNKPPESRTVDFGTEPKGRLLQILVGEFVADAQSIGDIEFSFTEISQYYKTGLIIKGAIVRPKH